MKLTFSISLWTEKGTSIEASSQAYQISERHYDAVVLGSGPSGRKVALRLANNSLSVALVENELVGGDRAYWACIPSKALLRPPEALTEAREVDGSRQAAQGPLSVKSTLTRRDTFVDHWKDDNLTKILQEGGVEIIRGQGKLEDHGV